MSSPAVAPSAARPLPRPEDLDLGHRALYAGAVAGDYAVRTAVATAAAAVGVPWALGGGWRAERRRLSFYADLAAARDAEAVFAAPDPAEVVATAGRGGLPGGRVEVLRWRSGSVARHPDLREAYAAHENNATARAQHWRHDDGPRPTLLVVHGFGASPARFKVAFFALRDVFAAGWDVVLHTLPFHGSRRGPRAPANGLELFAHGLAHLSEAVLQAVHDARVLVDHLAGQGVPRVGVTGLSLGGYVTGLLAATEPRLDFAVPNAPVTWIPELLDTWFPADHVVRLSRRLAGVPAHEVADALSVHSPLTYAPVLPRDRLMIVAGLGDRMAPPSQAERLWEHWGRPALHWFPGSHLLHVGRAEYRAAMWRLMDLAP